MTERRSRDVSVSQVETARVPKERCEAIAREILGKHRTEIADILRRQGLDFDPYRGIVEILDQFPDAVLEHYWAHGVTRGNPAQNLASAISILENGVIVGGTGLLASGQFGAYTNGDFMLIGQRGQQLIVQDRQTRSPVFVSIPGIETPACKVQFGAIVANTPMEPVVEELRSRYPNVKILRADELADYIRQEEGLNP